MTSRAAVVVNPRRQGVDEILVRLTRYLEGRGWRAAVDPAIRERLGLDVDPLDWNSLEADLVVTLGGDGTLLRAARALAGRPVPVFGVNMGGLGFLTATSAAGAWDGLDAVLDGRAPLERRMTLVAEILRGGIPIARHHALNEAVIHKGGSLRVIELRLSIGHDEIGSYVADGLILSTPTGATGYNLSADGPLVVPHLDLLVATPICAHTLAIRPLVVRATSTIIIEPMAEWATDVLVSFDGQTGSPLTAGERVEVRRAEQRVRIVRMGEDGWFGRMRRKLHWGDLSGRERPK